MKIVIYLKFGPWAFIMKVVIYSFGATSKKEVVVLEVLTTCGWNTTFSFAWNFLLKWITNWSDLKVKIFQLIPLMLLFALRTQSQLDCLYLMTPRADQKHKLIIVLCFVEGANFLFLLTKWLSFTRPLSPSSSGPLEIHLFSQRIFLWPSFIINY